MKITAIKSPAVHPNDSLFQILDESLPSIFEKSIIAVTSKIVALCEGRVVRIGEVDKDTLIKDEADYYLPREENKYHISLTITKNNLVATAGIDESNGDGYYVLWPKDLQRSANTIRQHLRKKHKIKNLGVILTDSRTTALRWGVTGTAIGYSGIAPLYNYIGNEDIFGKKLEYTQTSVIDGLAAAAVLTMGEGNEQTPLALIVDLPSFIDFKKNNPTKKEIMTMKISMEDDLYYPLLVNAKWRKGKSKKS